MRERVLTIRQPWADLIMAGVKDVENRTWPVPSTLPQWGDCPGHGRVLLDYPPDGHIADDGEHTDIVADHHPACMGDCHRHGCPIPVQVQRDPRYPCGPIEPDGPFPFRLWVHAGASVAPKSSPLWLRGGLPQDDLGIGIEWSRWASVFAPHARDSSPLAARLGALLGSVTVTGCHHAEDRECRRLVNIGSGSRAWERGCSRWAEPDVWHWTLAGPYADLSDPIPLRGRQGLWTLPDDALEAAGRQLAHAEGVPT